MLRKYFCKSFYNTVRRPIEYANTLDPKIYNCNDFYTAEKKQVWKRPTGRDNKMRERRRTQKLNSRTVTPNVTPTTDADGYIIYDD